MHGSPDSNARQADLSGQVHNPPWFSLRYANQNQEKKKEYKYKGLKPDVLFHVRHHRIIGLYNSLSFGYVRARSTAPAR